MMTVTLDGVCHLGFRIVGACHETRRLVDASAAFLAYCACDDRAEVFQEAYLSAFRYGDEICQRADEWNRLEVKSFDGVCWSPWLWFDIDNENDLEAARRDAARLCYTIVERYTLDDDDLLIFFSGKKGFGIGIPTSLWTPPPSVDFHHICKKHATGLAEQAQVAIDPIIYSKIQPHRAPNSRHPKTGLHKRRLSLDELVGLSVERIRQFAQEPLPFEISIPTRTCEQAASDWQAAQQAVQRRSEALATRRAAGVATRLNRQTLDIIRNVELIQSGDRHRLLFSAAANLAEFGCPEVLALALLTEPGLDSGLPPSDVRRQIECGLQHKSSKGSK